MLPGALVPPLWHAQAGFILEASCSPGPMEQDGCPHLRFGSAMGLCLWGAMGLF